MLRTAHRIQRRNNAVCPVGTLYVADCTSNSTSQQRRVPSGNAFCCGLHIEFDVATAPCAQWERFMLRTAHRLSTDVGKNVIVKNTIGKISRGENAIGENARW